MNPQTDPTSGIPDPRLREEQIKRAAQLGRARAEHEKQISDAIKSHRDDEDVRAHVMMDDAAVNNQEALDKKKAFRHMMKTREEEVAQDKKCRADLDARLLAEKKVIDDRRAKQKQSLTELHETSLIQQTEKKRQDQLKADRERERQKVEHDHRTKLSAAEHAGVTRKESLEHEAHARASMIDADSKTREYQLEEWKRSLMNQVDQEAQRQLAQAASVHGALHIPALRQAGDAALRLKRKHVEDEWRERTATIEQDARRRKSEIETDLHSKREQSDAERRRLIQKLDADHARALEEIDRKYRGLLRDSAR